MRCPTTALRILCLVAWMTTVSSSAATRNSLCADPSGVFVGLATDEEAYVSVSIPSSVDDEGNELQAQKWELTADASPDPHSGKPPVGPQHSFDRRFLQVLPDTGRSYPGRGLHLQHASQLMESGETPSPYVSFWLRVEHGRAGVHTLFLRWTGGDTVGGGDSLYVVLYRRHKGKRKRGGREAGILELVNGQQTVKPSVVPIDAGMSRYAGCCYDPVTHACPCFSETPPSNANANDTDPSSCPSERFIDRARAASFGVQCLVGGGAYTIVRKPEWYLYAGQEAGDVMDFDSEPWDVTCEADGSNTIDSGHDFPSWKLDEGDYELRIYAREDGTALDGIYVAGPLGSAPAVAKRYARGDSTLCPVPSRSATMVAISGVIGGSFLLMVLLGWWYTTPTGREVLGSVLSKPAQAVRYVYVETT